MGETTASFEAQLAAEHGGLLALARTLVRGSDVEPHDAVQDVLLGALDRVERPRALGAWLRQVLRNEIRGRMRSHRRRTDRSGQIPTPEPDVAADELANVSQVAAAVDDALAQLDEPYQSTVRRRFLEELAPEEIARLDGLPAATVRWRVHEGLRRMRAQLDDRFDGRAQWCGGFAVLLGVPMPVLGGVAMSKLLVVFVFVGLGITLFAAWPTAPDRAAAPRSEQRGGVAVPSQRLPTPVVDAAVAVAEPAAPSQSIDAEAPVDEEEVDERELLRRVLRDCIVDAPEGSLDGLERLEIDMVLFGADEGTQFSKVNVTTGRADGADDDVPGSLGPADAPGVIQHPGIRQCILDTVDPRWVPAQPFTGEYGGVGSVIVPLDGHGNVQRRERPPGTELPDVSGEPVVDPLRAVESFGLALEGPVDAKVQIVTCGSYDEPFSEKSDATLIEVRARFPGLAVAWLEMPRSSTAAVLAAKASVAAAKQQRFWPFHRALFAADEALDRDAVIAIAERVGLDRARFVADLDDVATARTVALQRRTCTQAGVSATPTFFVNGDLIRGELGADEMMKTVTAVAALEP